MTIYIYILSFIYSATNVVTCAGFHLKQIWRLTKAMTKIKREH